MSNRLNSYKLVKWTTYVLYTDWGSSTHYAGLSCHLDTWCNLFLWGAAGRSHGGMGHRRPGLQEQTSQDDNSLIEEQDSAIWWWIDNQSFHILLEYILEENGHALVLYAPALRRSTWASRKTHYLTHTFLFKTLGECFELGSEMVNVRLHSCAEVEPVRRVLVPFGHLTHAMLWLLLW